jgi:HD domain
MNTESAERLARQIEFIVEIDRLKEIFRQTIVTQSRRAENSAEHSWHLALLIVVLAEHSNQPNLDLLRILKMVLIHDLVEIDAGDTFAYDTQATSMSAKRRRQRGSLGCCLRTRRRNSGSSGMSSRRERHLRRNLRRPATDFTRCCSTA